MAVVPIRVPPFPGDALRAWWTRKDVRRLTLAPSLGFVVGILGTAFSGGLLWLLAIIWIWRRWGPTVLVGLFVGTMSYSTLHPFTGNDVEYHNGSARITAFSLDPGDRSGASVPIGSYANYSKGSGVYVTFGTSDSQGRAPIAVYGLGGRDDPLTLALQSSDGFSYWGEDGKGCVISLIDPDPLRSFSGVARCTSMDRVGVDNSAVTYPVSVEVLFDATP